MYILHSAITAVALLSSSAEAQGKRAGAFGELARDAERFPNATRSVPFKPFGNSTEWIWRVNVTDVKFSPNTSVRYPNLDRADDTGNRLISITYDFSWPGGGVISVPNSNHSFCATAPVTITSLANVTNKYTDANTDSADCHPVLGEDCVRAIERSAITGGGTHRCPSRVWTSIPECADSFGAYPLDPPNAWAMLTQDISGKASGERFHIITAGGYDGADASVYEKAVNMLQVVLLSPPPPAVNAARNPSLLCMRVETKQFPVEEHDGGEGSDGDDHDQNEGGDGENTAALCAARLWPTFGGMVVAALITQVVL